MPGAPRPNGKAKKIAYDLIGEPSNMGTKSTRGSKDRKEQRLLYEDTIAPR